MLYRVARREVDFHIKAGEVLEYALSPFDLGN
jgi:hypothetical protein